jgi:predicted RNase H-like HicB family nuclease
MDLAVIIELGEDGYFVARVPSLQGCWSQGITREEALNNIREAIELFLES